MKLLITKNMYKGSNVLLEVSGDCSNVKAWSYGWWQFVATDEVGNLIFNRARYSSSTGGHQRDCADLLIRLGLLPISLLLERTLMNLRDGIESAIRSEISIIQSEITELRELINKKGTHKRVNERRKERIEGLEYEIKDLERYLAEYHNRRKYSPSYSRSTKLSLLSPTSKKEWERHFLKPNGVLKRNEFQTFLNTYVPWWDAPEIGRLLTLFNINPRNELDRVCVLLGYRFANDLNSQIPEDTNSDEYLKLVRYLERRNEPLNLFTLDKLHTYLTNRENRKNSVPSTPVLLPISPELRALEGTEGLEVCDTVSKVRAEGKRQSHCIGSKPYIDKCKRGYQVVNFKGYTFFLSPSNQLIETHGKYNSQTPTSLVVELCGMIEKGAGRIAS